jgi:hypothetical protein
MCTLTFIPKPGGYLIGMNRDENRLRAAALLPSITERNGMETVYPREAETAGTWIAANATGVAMAILNQNRGPHTGDKLRSRGTLIPEVIHCLGMREIVPRIERLDLSGMLPFLALAISPQEQVIVEWRWDGASLKSRPWTWRDHHWFSSGISDSLATQVRGAFCHTAWQRRDAGSADWLRRVHAAHTPVRGSFSVCVHRPEAATVSYTEIAFDGRDLVMRYHAGQPCQALGRFDSEIVLHNPHFLAAAG